MNFMKKPELSIVLLLSVCKTIYRNGYDHHNHRKSDKKDQKRLFDY